MMRADLPKPANVIAPFKGVPLMAMPIGRPMRSVPACGG
jgi:hypothetical protein